MEVFRLVATLLVVSLNMAGIYCSAVLFYREGSGWNVAAIFASGLTAILLLTH